MSHFARLRFVSRHLLLSLYLHRTLVKLYFSCNPEDIPDELKVRMFQVPIEVGFLSEHEKEVFEEALLRALREFHKDY